MCISIALVVLQVTGASVQKATFLLGDTGDSAQLEHSVFWEMQKLDSKW